MNATEVWSEIRDHPGYEVSDQGRVRSYWTRSNRGRCTNVPHLLAGGMSGDYRQVRLRCGKHHKVHQLVLEAFVAPRPNGLVGRHLDGNALNNVPSNLRWGTQKENADDRARHGTETQGEQVHFAKLTDQTVREIRGASGTTRELAARFGVAPSTIWYVVSGRTWKHVQ